MKANIIILLSVTFLFGFDKFEGTDKYRYLINTNKTFGELSLEFRAWEEIPKIGSTYAAPAPGRFIGSYYIAKNNSKNDIAINFKDFTIQSSNGVLEPLLASKKGMKGKRFRNSIVIKAGSEVDFNIYYFAEHDVKISSIKLGKYGTFKFDYTVP